MILFPFFVRKNVFFFSFLCFITIGIKFSRCETAAILSGYDIRSAISAATLSALAYCRNTTILAGNYTFSQPLRNYQSGIILPNITDFIPTHSIRNSDHDVSGYIGYSISEETIFVVFRGTVSTQNWLNNFDTIKTGYPLCPGGEVHEGFYLSAKSVESNVLKWCQELQNRFPSFSVIVTGHSLGGALATLVSVHLALNNIINIKHYSFGSPRVANAAAASFISNVLPIARTTHYRDIVVHNPFVSFGYTHVTTEWYENNHGVIVACKGSEDKRCADQWTFLENFEDHYIYLGIRMTCTVDSGPSEIPKNDTNSDRGNRTSNVNSTDGDNPLPSMSPTSSPASSSPMTSSLPTPLPVTVPVLAPVEVQDPPNIVDSSLNADADADADTDADTDADADASIDSGDVQWLSTSRLPHVRTDAALFFGIIFIAIAIFIFTGVYRTLLARTIPVRGQYAAID